LQRNLDYRAFTHFFDDKIPAFRRAHHTSNQQPAP
jgi:hypothetical protein